MELITILVDTIVTLVKTLGGGVEGIFEFASSLSSDAAAAPAGE